MSIRLLDGASSVPMDKQKNANIRYRHFPIPYFRIILNEEVSFIERFQNIFEQSLMFATYVSDVFLQDLQALYPYLFEKITRAQQEQNKELKHFFISGIKEGIFNPINPDILMVQDNLVLRRLLDPSFSIQYDITMKQAILDFYKIKTFQIVHPSHLDSVDAIGIETKISSLIQKISVN